MSRRKYGADFADEAIRTGVVLPLLFHYLRDNPFPASLRSSARAFARHARDKTMPRDARRRSAVMATAQLVVAGALDPRTTKLP